MYSGSRFWRWLCLSESEIEPAEVVCGCLRQLSPQGATAGGRPRRTLTRNGGVSRVCHNRCRWSAWLKRCNTCLRLWCAVTIRICGIWSFIPLKGFEATNITESYRIAIVNDDVRWANRRVTEPVLMECRDSICQTVHPIQHKPSP